MEGVLWALGSSACFAGMGAFTKVAVPLAGVADVVFWRSVIVAAVSLGLALRKRQPLRPGRWGLLLARSGVGLVAMGLFFWSLGQVELGLANAMLYTSPIFLALLSWPLLRERVPLRAALAAGVGLAGVILIVRPGAVSLEVGLLAALGSGALAALAYIAVRRLRQSDPPERIVWFFAVFSSIFTLPFAITSGPAWGWEAAGPLAAVGLCAAGGQLAVTRAYALLEASQVGPLTNATVVFSWALGLAVWGESLGWVSGLGVGLVVLGAVGSGQRGSGRSKEADVHAEAAAEADEVGLREGGVAGLVLVFEADDAGGEEPAGAVGGEARGEVDAEARVEGDVAVAADVDQGEVEVIEAVAVDEAEEER